MRAACLERMVAGLDSWAARRGRTPELPAHLQSGIAGEEAACFYLLRQGYTVVARRWSSGHHAGDLDLVAWQGRVLCFFEVKTRTAHDLSPAEIAIDTHKRRLMGRLARQYLQQLFGGSAPQARFDVLSVYLEPGKSAEIEHFEGAFALREWQGADDRPGSKR
jgi:putative endonuclease